jgi:hypothetical protein
MIPVSPQLAYARYASPQLGGPAGEARVAPDGRSTDLASPRTGSPPNAGEARLGSPDGNRPSRTAGTLVDEPVERRILGLPVTAIVIAGVLLALVALAGIVIPRPGRRAHARERDVSAAVRVPAEREAPVGEHNSGSARGRDTRVAVSSASREK